VGCTDTWRRDSYWSFLTGPSRRWIRGGWRWRDLGQGVLATESWGSEQEASASCDYADGQDVPGLFGHEVGDYEI
jgi:hypothetical protein